MPGEMGIPREHAPVSPRALAAAVVAIVGARSATLVPLSASVPAMVMVDVAAIAFPLTGVILSTDVVRLDPVRALIRRPRPVAVVPRVARSLRIPIALDPHIVGAGLARDAVRARRWRLANANAEGHLRRGRRGRGEEQCRDSECLKDSFHEATLRHLVSPRLFLIAHRLFEECVRVPATLTP